MVNMKDQAGPITDFPPTMSAHQFPKGMKAAPMEHRRRLRYLSAVLIATALIATAARSHAAFSELGLAGQYAALTTYVGNQGPDVDIGSAATNIYGDVGLGPYSNGTAEKATIHGNFYVDSRSTTSIHSDLIVTGTRFNNQNLAPAVADAFAASAYFHSLTPQQTYGDIGGSFTFTGTSGRNVISLGSVNEQETLTISGPANSQFVFNISGGFILNGGTITLTGGVTPDNVLFNFNGTGNGVNLFKPVGYAQGIFLAPQRDIILDKATLVGAVIGGGNGRFVIHSGATLINPIPEVSSLMPLCGLLVAVFSTVYLRRRKAAEITARPAKYPR